MVDVQPFETASNWTATIALEKGAQEVELRESENSSARLVFRGIHHPLGVLIGV